MFAESTLVLGEHGVVAPRCFRKIGGAIESIVTQIDADGDDILLPVVGALRRSTNHSIAIQTRSIVDIGRIAAASVDVPEADRAQGLTVNFPKLGLAGDFIHVRRAAERPPTAAAATRFRDWWYYIAGDDLKSKQYFLMFQTLLSVQLSDDEAGSRAPVLTVPVN